jgi:transglutaminase-like putative cysteine protease
VAGERHLRVAVGRDYADVPPTRGVFKGRAATQLAVAVQVVPADEPLVDDEFLLSANLPADSGGGDAEQPQQQQQ